MHKKDSTSFQPPLNLALRKLTKTSSLLITNDIKSTDELSKIIKHFWVSNSVAKINVAKESTAAIEKNMDESSFFEYESYENTKEKGKSILET